MMGFFGSKTNDKTLDECLEKLRATDNLNAMMDVLDEYYDLDQPLSILHKNVIITALPKLVNTAGIKKR